MLLFQAQQAGQSKNEEKKKSVSTEAPRITPHVELPPQVLQVTTTLSHLYHLYTEITFRSMSNARSSSLDFGP